MATFRARLRQEYHSFAFALSLSLRCIRLLLPQRVGLLYISRCMSDIQDLSHINRSLNVLQCIDKVCHLQVKQEKKSRRACPLPDTLVKSLPGDFDAVGFLSQQDTIDCFHALSCLTAAVCSQKPTLSLSCTVNCFQCTHIYPLGVMLKLHYILWDIIGERIEFCGKNLN